MDVARWRSDERRSLKRLARARTQQRSRELARHVWSRPPVPARFHMTPSRRVAARPSDLVVNVSARPYGARTFVYLNGGSVIGTTPLPIQFDRPGRYKLLFWTPSLGRKVTRTVEVTGRGKQWVSATMGPSREVARGE